VQFVLDRLAHTFRAMESLEIFNKDEVASIVKKRTDYEYVMKRRQMSPGDVYQYIEYEINLEKLRLLRCSKSMQVHAKKLYKDALAAGNDAEDAGQDGEAQDRKSRKERAKRKAEAVASAAVKDRQSAIRNLQAASVRHICSVFERGIRRFPEEADLVLDYVSFLKDELTPATAGAAGATASGKGKKDTKSNDKYLVVSNKNNSATLNEVFGRALALHPRYVCTLVFVFFFVFVFATCIYMGARMTCTRHDSVN